MTEPTSNYRYSHTIPWSRAELLQVDGFRLVYSHDRERGLVVHLPGCREATLQELRDEGRTIVMPETPRAKRTMAHEQRVVDEKNEVSDRLSRLYTTWRRMLKRGNERNRVQR